MSNTSQKITIGICNTTSQNATMSTIDTTCCMNRPQESKKALLNSISTIGTVEQSSNIRLGDQNHEKYYWSKMDSAASNQFV